ncbi:MAG: T9SS type A sorting domain-containing protein [Flavobacteriaceae bacterium]|nr:T9SS type A sorting domain-containing protein [Flavobacteriaceae bacterium]
MKKFTLPIVLCGLLTFSVSGQQINNDVPVLTSGVSTTSIITNTQNRVVCDGVLANYTNSIPDGAGGVTSQDFEAANDAYDSFAADDFVAPAGGVSYICEVAITGIITGGGLLADPNSAIVLRVFDDTGAGTPGTQLFTETFPGTTDANNDGSFILEPTVLFPLTGSTHYWLSVQVSMDFGLGGQWFWDTAGDANDDIFAWQNPGGGFGMGCAVWSPHTVCGLAGTADLLMDISFNSVLGTNSNSLEAAVNIFPNPAQSQFTLRSDVSLKKLTIFDVRGRVVNNVDLSEMSHEKTIDISSLVPGIYLVQIASDKGTVVKHLSKR